MCLQARSYQKHMGKVKTCRNDIGFVQLQHPHCIRKSHDLSAKEELKVKGIGLLEAISLIVFRQRTLPTKSCYLHRRF